MMVENQAKNISQQFKKHGLRPNKKLGQNFLVDAIHLQSIVDKSGLTEHDFVLEIGAGLGALTSELAQKAKSVIAIEIDRGLFPLLQENIREYSNVSVILGDILAMDLK